MEINEMITTLLSTLSFILSSLALYYSKFFKHNSLILNIISISYSKSYVMKFIIGNIGNQEVLINDVEIIVEYPLQEDNEVEPLPGNPVPNSQGIPKVIKPNEIHIQEVGLSSDTAAEIRKNNANILVIFTIVTINCQIKYLVKRFNFRSVIIKPDNMPVKLSSYRPDDS